MYELFFRHFNERVQLTPREEEEISHFLTPKKLRRKHYLLQEGDVCKYIAFIEKGALKSYSVDDNGSEHILQFGLEDWTIADLYSFLTGEPATYNIDAIEDSELVLIGKTAHEQMLTRFPKYETYTRMNITGAYLAMQKRLMSIISSPIDERYAVFNALYPDIVQRVPQHMIASYMGLTPETLSRVRKRISAK